MTGLRSAAAALVAASLVAACGVDDHASERERPGGEDVERPQPAKVDVELVPAEALAGLAATLEAAEPGAFALCPEYAEPAGRALARLAGALDDASEIESATAAAALEALVSEARSAGDELAELSPTVPRAARRHAELTAATRDLADGFSALGEALADAERELARAAAARTENGLANVGAALDAVLAACR